MATGPSPRVRQEFRKYLTNTVAAEGEPAALGKSATGPVYYTDYDGVVHKNRVWFRKGANKEIVGVARADNQGLPDVPNLPIRVARRFGSNWVVDWQRENAAVPTGGGGGSTSTGIHRLPAWLFGPPDASSITNPTFTHYWKYADSVDGSEVNTTFIATGNSDELTVDFYWYDLASTPADVVWSLSFSAESDGESFADSWEWEFHTVSGVNQFDLHKETFTFSFTSGSFTTGDVVQIGISRRGGNVADTSTGDAGFIHATVYEEGATAGGGATSTASGVHKFSPAQMLAAQNASETSVNSLATPAIAIPDSGATPTINVAFLAEKTSATLDIDIYAVTASGSGDVVLDADAYSGATDGTGTPTDNNGFVTDGTFAADGNIRIFPLTVAFTTQPDLTPGDYCSLRIQRLVASGSDTLAADLHVLMIVVTENGDG